jgi:hypothetical protein
LVYGRFVLPARYYSGVKSFAQKNNFAITVFASHRNERNEILSVADYSLTEPEDPQKRLQFIRKPFRPTASTIFILAVTASGLKNTVQPLNRPVPPLLPVQRASTG